MAFSKRLEINTSTFNQSYRVQSVIPRSKLTLYPSNHDNGTDSSEEGISYLKQKKNSELSYWKSILTGGTSGLSGVRTYNVHIYIGTYTKTPKNPKLR